MNINKLLADIDAIHDNIRDCAKADPSNDKLAETEAAVADLRDRVQDEGVKD
jgi:hypothetical protein